MKKQIKILAVFLFTILFFNCSKDDLENHSNHTHSHTSKDEISFKQFKNETDINKFDYIKKANISKSTDFQARSIESEFVTDTIGIKKYVNPTDNKTTYSFKIYPISESLSSNEYYNLVYEKIGTEWNEIIFFNTKKTNPTDARVLESSEMVYNRISGRDGFSEVITYSYHCTGCTGACDMCNLCVSTHVSYIYTGIEDTSGGFNGNPVEGNPSNTNPGGGGEGNGIFIPNPYDGDADPNNAGFMLAGQVAAYTNTLPTNLQSLISNYNFVYPYIVDFCRNNGNSVGTRNIQKITTALNNFYNFQLNTSYNNLTNVNIERFNFWAFYTFLNNNPQDVNNTKINDIKNFVQSTDYETANDIVDYLFQNKDDEEAVDRVSSLINLSASGNLINFLPDFKYPAGSNYSTQYPKLTEYLKNKIPALKNNQFIINKLVQYSELNSQQIINDLKWGQGPTIQIAQLDSRGVNCYGIFSSATPNVLTIDIDFVNLLENSTPGPEGDSLAFLLGVTILHEYVHLGDFVDGIDQPGEEGLLFEQATYGETIWLNNAGDVLIKWQ